MSTRPKTKEAKISDIIAKVKKSEQLISMVLGIIVVLVVGGLAYRYFKNGQISNLLEEKLEVSQENKAAQEKEIEVEEKGLPQIHKVGPGESLWKIAERYYQSGYNWVDIAKANNLKNPNILLVGQELKIPDVPARKPTIARLPQTGTITIQEDHYTVQKGDSLSKIAGAAYGDIFSWPKIWDANKDKISNPDLIFPGQTLKIPR